MSEDLLIGLAATAIPLLAIGYLLLRSMPMIFRFFVALLLVGLGYLAVTDALSDIGRMLQGKDSPVVEPAAAPAAAPEAAPTPAPAAVEPETAPAPEPQAEEPLLEPEASQPPADAPGDAATPPEALPPANP